MGIACLNVYAGAVLLAYGVAYRFVAVVFPGCLLITAHGLVVQLRGRDMFTFYRATAAVCHCTRQTCRLVVATPLHRLRRLATR